MPKLKNEVPKLAKSGNYACVYYGGQRHRLGIWGSQDAKTAYSRFIAELQANPVTFGVTQQSSDEVLVAELAACYFKDIQGRMHPTHVSHFKVTIGYLVEVYGDIAVDTFTPKKLKVVRDRMVRSGKLCRRMVNDFTSRIVRIFSWGVEEELAHPNTVSALREVKALPKGTPGTFDHPEREGVPEWVVALTLTFLAPVVAAMVVIQYLTGMRPSEVFNMRVGEIDRSRGNGLWYYTPKSHKTEEHIGKKPIPLGKPEQDLIAPYLEGRKMEEAVFSPRMAMAERNVERNANRKTKRSPSHEAKIKERSKKPSAYHEFYNHHSYRQAVEYGIVKGNKTLPPDQQIPRWTPYQLRHAAGTEAEKTEGLDKAQALLGHRTANTTKRYAHGQLAIAESMARTRKNPFVGSEDTLPEQ